MSFKILKITVVDLMSIKPGSLPASVLLIPTAVQNITSPLFFLFKGLQKLCDWLAKYNCTDVCMESTGKYWIPVFNVLEKKQHLVTLSHPKYTKPQKGNKTDRKDARWICDLYMCGMVKPSFIPPADIRGLRDL